jgi:hypothetical protein
MGLPTFLKVTANWMRMKAEEKRRHRAEALHASALEYAAAFLESAHPNDRPRSDEAAVRADERTRIAKALDAKAIELLAAAQENASADESERLTAAGGGYSEAAEFVAWMGDGE